MIRNIVRFRESGDLQSGPGSEEPGLEVRVRRVLMFSYYFPPIITSGAARNLGFARHLPTFGWEPIVLSVNEPKDSWGIDGIGSCVEWDGLIERTSEWNLTRAVDLADAVVSRAFDSKINLVRDLACIPDPQLAWAPIATAVRLAKSCDCIYVSASPFSSAIWATLTAKISGKPLISDFRDPWTLNPFTHHTRWHAALSRRQERWVISHSARLILNTQGTLKLYSEAYPEFRDRLTWIPNGYDELNIAESRRPGEPFRIMHFGSFYGGRHPGNLLKAMSELPSLPIEFIQVGRGLEPVDDSRVSIIAPVERQKAQELMRTASLLYLKQGGSNKSLVSIGAKTYEYLATGLPILAECPDGDNANIIEQYGSRSYVVKNESVEDIKSAIVNAFEHSMDYVPSVSRLYVENFSREKLAGRLADELSTATRGERAWS